MTDPTAPYFLKDARALIAASLLTALFISISVWFHIHDVYNWHFDDSGSLYWTYNLLKLVSAVYLIWLSYFVGHVALYRLQLRGYDFSLTSVDYAISAFYVGSSIFGISMYVLGYLNLYYRGVAVILIAPIVFCSFPHLGGLLGKMRSWVSELTMGSAFGIRALLSTIVVVLLLAILLNKAIFPTSDWDSLTHYLQYYREVIHNHGLAANNVWYHYYYSKGAGLMYLSMLLTDEMGASLASFYMTLGSAAVVYSLSRKVSGDADWSIAVVITYLCFLPLNPQVVFEKQHILMTSLFAGIIFMIAVMPAVPERAQRAWTTLLSLVLLHLAIFAPTGIAFISPLFAIVALFYFVRRKREMARMYGFIFVVAGGAVILICGINYFITGMPEINPARLMWTIADQKVFSRWTSPYMMVYLNEGSNPTMGTFTFAKQMRMVEWFTNLFHVQQFEYLFPNLVVGSLVILLALIASRDTARLKSIGVVTMPVLVLLVTAGLASLIFNQPESMFRYFVFTTPLLTVLITSIWYMAVRPLLTFSGAKKMIALWLAIAAIYALIPSFAVLGRIYDYERPEVQFLTGALSFRDAFAVQQVLWPELVAAKQAVGIERRVVSLNLLEGIGAVPGRSVESEVNYNYRDWHLMVFGTPAIAKAALIKEGLNYFVIGLNRRFNGCLPLSPLFAPETLNDRFDVIYADGDTFMLTWKGSGRAVGKLSPRAIDVLKSHISSQIPLNDLYSRVNGYFQRNKGESYPVYSDRSLPPLRGWQ